MLERKQKIVKISVKIFFFRDFFCWFFSCLRKRQNNSHDEHFHVLFVMFYYELVIRVSNGIFGQNLKKIKILAKNP